jgi:transposase IS66 family protein
MNWAGAMDRGNLLRYIEDTRIESINNHAERALRPTVIARKVSHCSKNDGGAHVLADFASVVRTLPKNCIDSFVEGLYHLFGTPNAQPVSS